jgi:hypothetical protein
MDKLEEVPEDDPRLARAREAKIATRSRLRSYPNVVGVGVGFKVVGGKRTSEICVRVYVKKKLPKAQLKPHELIPPRVRGVPTDVIKSDVIAYMPPIDARRGRRGTMQGGCSVGIHPRWLGNDPRWLVGTLGISVFDNVSREDVLLSCWHVLCGADDPAVKETISHRTDTDGGVAYDVVGVLERWRLNDEVDAAIARLTGHRFLLKRVLEIGPVLEATAPLLGMSVRKFGRTTGLTSGVIMDLEAETEVTYRNLPDAPKNTFVEQIFVEGDEPVAKAGDSGSVWVDSQNRAVAMAIGGPSEEPYDHCYANRFTTVLQQLNVNLMTGVTQQDFIASTSHLLL